MTILNFTLVFAVFKVGLCFLPMSAWGQFVEWGYMKVSFDV